MKAPSLILIIFLVCMIILLAGLQLVGEHNQRTNNQTMEKVIAELTDRSRGLESEIKDLRTQLAAREQQARTDSKEPAPQPVAQAASTNSPAAKPVQPQAFQAKAYVGKDYLGTAWVVPSNVRQDPESGEFRFEPVIWIDEKSRSAFTQTNVVEREVVRNSSYTQVYQQPYWYGYGYPVWVNPHPQHPGKTPPPQQQPPRVQPLSPQGSGPWAPVSGGVQRVPASSGASKMADLPGGNTF